MVVSSSRRRFLSGITRGWAIIWALGLGLGLVEHWPRAMDITYKSAGHSSSVCVWFLCVADGFSDKNTCVYDDHSSRGKSTMCFTDPLNPFIIPIILFSSKKTF
jgi:hypothetical protein